jgi:O-acetyl-ADP-ribose deacetylase (regulator of RNase III)
MERTVAGARLVLLLGDLTRQAVDAVVNAANSGLLGGGGVDGAIHAAGGPAIVAECRVIRERQGRLPPGEAVVTTAGRLPARRVIHTVGPVWYGGDEDEAGTLARAYRSSLTVAREEGLRTVAFPSISTGAYGYPVDQAASVALAAVRDELQAHPGSFDEIRFVLFQQWTYEAYCRALEASSWD